MAVMAVDGAPVAVTERLEAFASEVLSAAMNRPVQRVNSRAQRAARLDIESRRLDGDRGPLAALGR